MINILLSQYNFHEHWARDKINKYFKVTQKVLIIPFSFGYKIQNQSQWDKAYHKDFGMYYHSVVSPFLSYGIKESNIKWINYFTDTINEAKEKIKASDVLFFTGGYPDKMMKRLEEFELIETLENFNGIIIGSSAGAMIQIKQYHITPDEDYQHFGYYNGLNLINCFDIEVHYKNTNIQNEYIHKVLDYKAYPVYAISDKGGLVVDNNNIELIGNVITFNPRI